MFLDRTRLIQPIHNTQLKQTSDFVSFAIFGQNDAGGKICQAEIFQPQIAKKVKGKAHGVILQNAQGKIVQCECTIYLLPINAAEKK